MLLNLLTSRRHGLTVAELKDYFNVSLKTIRRDLKRLQECGFPLSETTEDHGRRRWTLSGNKIAGAGLGFDEAFALLLLVGSLGSLAKTEIGKAAISAVKKLRSGLSDNVLAYCDRYARTIALQQPRTVDYSDKSDILVQLVMSLEEHKNVFITYQSRRSTEPISYPISPYAIRHYQNSLYVIGFSEQHNEIRTFKVDRISAAEKTDFPYTIPSGFCVEDYLAPCFGVYGGQERIELVIRFSSDATRAVTESKWHPSQQVEMQGDGTAIATYQVANTPELRGWLLSFGSDIKILSPTTVAQQIQAEATTIAKQYTEVKNAT